MALRFIARARTRRSDCPSDADLAGWLALMQHYRLPTRLLDWSELPLVALYFAVTEAPDSDGTLWALNPYRFNQRVIGQPVLQGAGGPQARGFFADVFSSSAKPENRALALAPWEVDIRMLVQGAAFTVHDSSQPLDAHSAASGALDAYRIPASAKKALQRHLFLLGVRRSMLFPDLENLAAELRAYQYLEYPESSDDRPAAT